MQYSRGPETSDAGQLVQLAQEGLCSGRSGTRPDWWTTAAWWSGRSECTALEKVVSGTVGCPPVFLGNDANCAAVGEYWAGAAKGCDPAVVITLGTGIGGGLVSGESCLPATPIRWW